jgi:hypothetical protein
MAVLVKTLILPKQAENSQTTQYTATNCRAIIDKFTVTNTNTANVTFSVNLVAAAGSAGTANLIVKARSIVPGETYLCPELVGQVLEPSAFISTLAGTASALTITASGREVT